MRRNAVIRGDLRLRHPVREATENPALARAWVVRALADLRGGSGDAPTLAVVGRAGGHAGSSLPLSAGVRLFAFAQSGL